MLSEKIKLRWLLPYIIDTSNNPIHLLAVGHENKNYIPEFYIEMMMMTRVIHVEKAKQI